MGFWSTLWDIGCRVVSVVKTIFGLDEAFSGGSSERLVSENKSDEIKKRQDCIAECLKVLKPRVSTEGEKLSKTFSEPYEALFAEIEKTLPMIKTKHLKESVDFRAHELKADLRNYLIEHTDLGCIALEQLCDEIHKKDMKSEEIKTKVNEYFVEVVKDGLSKTIVKSRQFLTELNQLFMEDYEQVEQLWSKDIEDKRQQLESYRGEKEEKQAAILKGFADIVQGELAKYHAQADLV